LLVINIARKDTNKFPYRQAICDFFLLIVWWARFLLLNLHRDEEDKEETQ